MSPLRHSAELVDVLRKVQDLQALSKTSGSGAASSSSRSNLPPSTMSPSRTRRSQSSTLRRERAPHLELLRARVSLAMRGTGMAHDALGARHVAVQAAHQHEHLQALQAPRHLFSDLRAHHVAPPQLPAREAPPATPRPRRARAPPRLSLLPSLPRARSVARPFALLGGLRGLRASVHTGAFPGQCPCNRAWTWQSGHLALAPDLEPPEHLLPPPERGFPQRAADLNLPCSCWPGSSPWCSAAGLVSADDVRRSARLVRREPPGADFRCARTTARGLVCTRWPSGNLAGLWRREVPRPPETGLAMTGVRHWAPSAVEHNSSKKSAVRRSPGRSPTGSLAAKALPDSKLSSTRSFALPRPFEVPASSGHPNRHALQCRIQRLRPFPALLGQQVPNSRVSYSAGRVQNSPLLRRCLPGTRAREDSALNVAKQECRSGAGGRLPAHAVPLW